MNKSLDHILVSVCVATFKREAQLESLLKSLLKQKTDDLFQIEIIIVDNDNNKSAKNIFQKIKNISNISIKYFVQPERNISLTRNVCVQEASGKFLSFIDDDEVASESWLINHYNTLKTLNADGSFGFVVPVYNNNIPNHFRNRDFYFSEMLKTGSESNHCFTTNAFISAELLKNEPVPFNPDYGLTGGEDAHLFERLIDKGAKFVDCKEAITYEFVPEERANFRYLYNRALRGGQSYGRRKLEKNNKFLFRLLVFIKALVVLIYSSIFLLFYIFSKYKRIFFVQIIGAAIGKLRALFHLYKNLY